MKCSVACKFFYDSSVIMSLIYVALCGYTVDY